MPPSTPIDRPDPFVLLRFLERLYFEPGEEPARLTRSALQRATRVNYDIFRRYLDLLLSRRFVEPLQDPRKGEVLQLTAEGRAFYRRSLDWIEAIFGRGRP